MRTRPRLILPTLHLHRNVVPGFSRAVNPNPHSSRSAHSPAGLARQLVGQGRVGREQGEGDVPAAEHVAPAGRERREAEVLLDQFLPVVIGPAVDEDLLLRPGVEDVPAPDELAVGPAGEALRPACSTAAIGKTFGSNRSVTISVPPTYRASARAPPSHREQQARHATVLRLGSCAKARRTRRRTGRARHSGSRCQA